ncbi:hypothetical protein DFH06DRAFT_1326807 [Mycena polygramma]|nr:hypothetical protein DFH06DRAFT_1326807 [Mycena polygramma]
MLALFVLGAPASSPARPAPAPAPAAALGSIYSTSMPVPYCRFPLIPFIFIYPFYVAPPPFLCYSLGASIGDCLPTPPLTPARPALCPALPSPLRSSSHLPKSAPLALSDAPPSVIAASSSSCHLPALLSPLFVVSRLPFVLLPLIFCCHSFTIAHLALISLSTTYSLLLKIGQKTKVRFIT